MEVNRSDARLAQLEVRIGQLNMEKQDHAEEMRQFKSKYDELMLSVDGHKADKMFLRAQIEELQEELKQKDETIFALSMKITEKGEENRQLSEIVNTFKNQIIADKVFEQKFTVTFVGQLMSSEYTFRFVRDKSEDGEFFLEMQPVATGDKSKKRICVIDIEDIEPVQGTKFYLKYWHTPSLMSMSSLSLKKPARQLKTETYQSKHLADILDCFEQVHKKIEEQEKELDAFLAIQEAR